MKEGLVINSKLRLVRQLGQGGMGTVWLADHLELNRSVAVKFISDDQPVLSDRLRRFERESTAVAALKHPQIVEVIEHGIHESGLLYIVTEFLEGQDLGAVLSREKVLGLEEASKVIDQLCDALAFAHDLGIVHRDIKPENVFLTRKGRRRLCKARRFGIAKSWQTPELDVTTTGVVIGTPHYMSPEQFMREARRLPSRFLGLVCSPTGSSPGRLPFDATNYAMLCVQIHRGLFPKATAYRQGLPSRMNDWFTKAMRGHPAARFMSARAMASAFRSAIAGASATEAHGPRGGDQK